MHVFEAVKVTGKGWCKSYYNQAENINELQGPKQAPFLMEAILKVFMMACPQIRRSAHNHTYIAFNKNANENKMNMSEFRTTYPPENVFVMDAGAAAAEVVVWEVLGRAVVVGGCGVEVVAGVGVEVVTGIGVVAEGGATVAGGGGGGGGVDAGEMH